MYNKKKIATLLVIGMAAMFMMNGCQKKASETETTKQTTAQSESTAQTEAATTYTSESNSFSFDLPDSAWVATKEGIENKWAFMKEGVGTIRITHKKSKIKEKNLPQSQEDAIALLNDIQENAFSQVEYKKDSTNGTELYYYAASTQDADLGYIYLIKYLINTDTESYTITAKLTSSDSTVQQAVKSAVTSFKVLNDDSKKTDSDANSGSSADGSTSSDNAGNSSDPENTGDTASDNTSGESTGDSSGASTDEEYRYFFDANGNTIYAYPSEDGTWRDDNGTSYIFLENGVEDSNGTQYYYDPPQGTTGSGSESDSLTGSGNSSDNGMVIGFYDINGNYQTATQDANGNWIGSDGKTYTFDEKGATDSDGNFSKW